MIHRNGGGLWQRSAGLVESRRKASTPAEAARRVYTEWLNFTHSAARSQRDPILSALLVAQITLIFVAEPLALAGVASPLIAVAIITAVLILALVLGSHQRGAFIVIGVGGVRLLAGAADLVWHASWTEGAEAFSAVLALLSLVWAIFEVVFGPGEITSHRVRGAIVLYLTIAVLFAWLYLLIAEIMPGSFSGLVFRSTPGALSPFLYYSLTCLTTIGFGDITPLHAFARNLTMLEAVVGELFPSIILARVLTLYAASKTPHQEPHLSRTPSRQPPNLTRE